MDWFALFIERLLEQPIITYRGASVSVRAKTACPSSIDIRHSWIQVCVSKMNLWAWSLTQYWKHERDWVYKWLTVEILHRAERATVQCIVQVSSCITKTTRHAEGDSYAQSKRENLESNMQPSELLYDGAMSLGRPPFCNRRVSPSSEQLHSQMWLHPFDVISLSIMSGRNNIRYKYYKICFGIYMRAESVTSVLVASCATVH